MRLFRNCFIVLATTLMAACSSPNISQKLDSFVDNAELKSSDYDADDWQKSILEYDKLVKQYTTSGKGHTDAEKQMVARAMGRYHSLLIKNGVEQSAAYLKELESILPSYMEGLVDGFDKNSEELERALEGIFNSEDLEKAVDGLGNKREELFGGIEDTR